MTLTLLLTERLKTGTKVMHREVERAGLMSSLLRGHIDCRDYCRLLRNLHAIYAALEAALARHAQHPQIAPAHMPQIARSQSLAADLAFLHGPDWSADIAVEDATHDYVERVRRLAETLPQGLAAHAYLRYLGDLNGGQLLRGIVVTALRLEDDRGSAFYRFGNADTNLLAQRFRDGLNAIPLSGEPEAEALLDEARLGFTLHARLFEQLADGSGDQSSGG